MASLSSSRRNDDGQQVHKGAQLGGRSFLTPSKPAAAAPLQSDQGGNNGVLSGVKLRSVSRSNNRRGGGSPRGGANPESASKQKLSWTAADGGSSRPQPPTGLTQDEETLLDGTASSPAAIARS